MKKVFIYALIDPRNDHVRYIGKANNPEQRYADHIKEIYNSHKSYWIQSLIKLDLLPILFIVDEVLENEWVFWEKHYISLYRSFGFNLTNQTEGGDCCDILSNHPRRKEIINKMILAKSFNKKVQSITDTNKLSIRYSSIYEDDNIKQNISQSIKLSWQNKEIKQKRKNGIKSSWNNRKLYKVYVYTADNKQYKIFNSLSACSKWFNTKKNTLLKFLDNNFLFRNLYYIKTNEIK